MTDHSDLIQFREDILRSLASLDVEISAIHKALLECDCIDKDRLKYLREKSHEEFSSVIDRYRQTIANLHND